MKSVTARFPSREIRADGIRVIFSTGHSLDVDSLDRADGGIFAGTPDGILRYIPLGAFSQIVFTGAVESRRTPAQEKKA